MILEMLTVPSSNNKKCKFKIEVKLLKKKSKVRVIIKSACIGVNDDHMNKMTQILEEFFQLRFHEQVDIAISRTKMQMNYNKDKETGNIIIIIIIIIITITINYKQKKNERGRTG